MYQPTEQRQRRRRHPPYVLPALLPRAQAVLDRHLVIGEGQSDVLGGDEAVGCLHRVRRREHRGVADGERPGPAGVPGSRRKFPV